MRRTTTGGILLLSLTTSSAALADSGEACRVSPPRDAAQARARLDHIEKIFERREAEMRLWFGSFAALHTAMAGASAILAVQEDDPDMRGAIWVGAAGSTLALISLLAVRPPLIGAVAELRGLPAESEKQLRGKLAFAEGRLKRSAEAARRLRSPWPRILSGAYSLGSAALVWWAFDSPLGAAQQIGGGILIGQGRISLHPIGVAEDWQAYAHQYGACADGSVASASASTWALTPSPGGLSLQLRF